MRVPEKYSTLPAEDRSVHIVNICAIEDLGYLPSEGTVSSGAVPGDLSASRKALGAPTHTRAARGRAAAAAKCARLAALCASSHPWNAAPGVPRGSLGSPAEPGPGLAASSARVPQSVSGVSAAHCQGSSECPEVSRVSSKSRGARPGGLQSVLQGPQSVLEIFTARSQGSPECTQRPTRALQGPQGPKKCLSRSLLLLGSLECPGVPGSTWPVLPVS